MTFVLGLLAVIAVISSILLMFVILLQEPKGGGLAAALGGSGMDAIGANVGQVNKFTTSVAAVWMGACLLHAILQPVGVDLGKAAAVSSGGKNTASETPPTIPPGDGDKEPK